MQDVRAGALFERGCFIFSQPTTQGLALLDSSDKGSVYLYLSRLALLLNKAF
jgi:hypothetical protein